MKVVDAAWEKRNLGVSCYEFHIDHKDSMEEVKEICKKAGERQYMVVRIPSNRSDLVSFFQKEGYEFMESAFTLEHKLNDITMPPRLLSICRKCAWEKMTKNDMQILSREIYKNIFQTDRISIDPEFTREQAARRYDLWAKDLIRKGHIPYKVMFAGEPVGFFLNREMDDGIYDGLLAGTYSGFEGTGMGYCIQYAGIWSAKEKGARGYIGHISGNNPSVLKILLSIGFQMKEIAYIFIKHSKGEI